jgi:hypothetical protein
MARTQQTFVNDRDCPIYISVEPWPHCFELEPEDKLTLIWVAPDTGDALEVSFVTERELTVSPNGKLDDLQILFNDGPATDRSWAFKHRL